MSGRIQRSTALPRMRSLLLKPFSQSKKEQKVNDVMIFSVISLGAIGIAAAVILYFVAQRFKVIEDPKIDEVEEALPAAR